MPTDSSGPTMRQKIFSMNLDVETTSLYLLCCAIADAGGPITPDTLMDKWNGDRTSLEKEVRLLEKRNIIRKIEDTRGGPPIYRIADEKDWY